MYLHLLVVYPELCYIPCASLHLFDDLLNLVQALVWVAVLNLSTYDASGTREDSISILVEDTYGIGFIYEREFHGKSVKYCLQGLLA